MEVKVRRPITVTRTTVMANQMTCEALVDGLSCLDAIAAICRPLHLDLDVDLGVDMDHVFTNRAGKCLPSIV